MWVNKIAPYNNPQGTEFLSFLRFFSSFTETYEYYSLPFCAPKTKVGVTETLGESLSGFELHASPMIINFKVDVPSTKLCRLVFKNEWKIKKDPTFFFR